MADTGWLDFGTFGNKVWLPNTNASQGWTSPGNAAISDNAYATRSGNIFTLAGAVLEGSNAGAGVPSGATIDGIEVRFEASYLSNPMNIEQVGLTKDGSSLAGSAKGSPGGPIQPLTTTDTYYVLGSPTDLWDTTWTDSEVNAITFGAGLDPSAASGSNGIVRVDHMQVRIHYTPAGETITANHLDLSPTLHVAEIDQATVIPGLLLDLSPTFHNATFGAGEATIDAALLDLSPALHNATVTQTTTILAEQLDLSPTFHLSAITFEQFIEGALLDIGLQLFPAQAVSEVAQSVPILAIRATNEHYRIRSTQPRYEIVATGEQYRIVSTEESYRLRVTNEPYQIRRT